MNGADPTSDSTLGPEWTRVGSSSEMPAVGETLEVALENGDRILLVGTGARLAVCAADCPHLDTPLTDALVEGERLTCLMHLWQWDLADGTPLGEAELPLTVYDVQEKDDVVYIKTGAKHS